MFGGYFASKEETEQQHKEQDDVQSQSMHGRLMVSSRNMMFGSNHSRDSHDLEEGKKHVQYRLQAVAVRIYCIHVKLYLC
jgi:uncharacterized glyoxalase superfamily protein PhnB